EVEHSDNNANGWKGMQKFSIQSPLSRNMLNEYVFHQLLADEGVLTPSYQFLPTQLNGEMIGIMAIEGHFTPELLTQQNRHPGPILKFNENHLWDMRAKKIEHISEYPTVEAAEVKVFSKRTYQSDTALALVERGRSLLYAHQQNLAPLDSLFNVDLLAKYFAICEVIGAAHSYLWHNTRYYYNERVDRLEPIGFDGNPSINPNLSDFHLLPTFKKPFIREKRVVNLVSSVNFQKAFIAYLRKFSSEAYLLEFFSKHAMELKKQESILQREYPHYVFPRAALFYRASKIQTMYSDWKLSTVQCRSASFVSVDHSVVPFPGISVVAYKKKLANEFVQIDVLNYFNEEFTIVSVHNANNTKRIESKKVLAPFNSPNQPDRISLVIPFSPTHVTVRFNSLDQEYEVKISKYQFPNILN
ncbi:MAG: CotH kinase family protein, partial [Flavobacteriales bacterium]|nr:CotH kinase family protein [Flavobacteriales bacterium]